MKGAYAMASKLRLFLAVVFIVTSASRMGVEARTDDRALALLRGVENSRLELPSGRLDLVALYQSLEIRNEVNLVVVFDGSRRRFIVDAPRMGPRTIMNGTDLLHFDGVESCTIRQPLNELADYCFDPRTLGITGSYLVEDTVESCLAYRNAHSVELVGSERVDNKSTWHVRVIDAYNQQLDFWIGDSDVFPVYQYEFRTPGATRRTLCVSTYDDQGHDAHLPVEVQTSTFNKAESLVERRIMRVERADWGVAIDPITWELNGLELPVGTPVADLRVKHRIGYWNGSGLSREPPPIVATLRPAETTRSFGIWFWIVGVGAAALLVAWGVAYRRRRVE